MLELKECCKVPFPEKLFEGYEIKDGAICANVNASKVLEMMRRFIHMHNEPLFFILEIPCRKKEGMAEEKRNHGAGDARDVYFMDGLNAERATQIVDALGNFLVKDGLNAFGIGGHESREEILFDQYNVMTIYAKNAEAYREFMRSFGITKTDALVTAWATFDSEHPGDCECYVSEETGKTIYDIPEAYKEYGMYFYETREVYNENAEKEITLDDLPGKVLLVGITYYTHDKEYIEQRQFCGTVVEASETLVRIKQKDGTDFTLPPDLRSTQRARPGEYKLRSTGEVVVNPDFLATWTVIKGE